MFVYMRSQNETLPTAVQDKDHLVCLHPICLLTITSGYKSVTGDWITEKSDCIPKPCNVAELYHCHCTGLQYMGFWRPSGTGLYHVIINDYDLLPSWVGQVCHNPNRPDTTTWDSYVQSWQIQAATGGRLDLTICFKYYFYITFMYISSLGYPCWYPSLEFNFVHHPCMDYPDFLRDSYSCGMW